MTDRRSELDSGVRCVGVSGKYFEILTDAEPLDRNFRMPHEDKTSEPGESKPVENERSPQIINIRDLEGEAALAHEMERPENQAKILDILQARQRRAQDPPQYVPGTFLAISLSETARAIMAAALRQIADALASGAPYIGGGVACSMDDDNVVTMRSDLKVQLPIINAEWKPTPDGKGIMRDPPLTQ